MSVEVRYTISDEMDELLGKACKNLGLKKSEFARNALMRYLESLSMISTKVKE